VNTIPLAELQTSKVFVTVALVDSPGRAGVALLSLGRLN
jgi:hypothetical protein